LLIFPSIFEILCEFLYSCGCVYSKNKVSFRDRSPIDKASSRVKPNTESSVILLGIFIDLLQVAKRVRKDAGRAGQAAEDTGEGECETEA
jgi:hypothetical protein